jgi:hypothetical protein
MGATTAVTEGSEAALRCKLGIPVDAERVLIFTETSHWDPDWMLKAKEYFEIRVGPHLEQAVRELQKDERRVYSVECAFFLRMFLESRPSKRDAVVELVNQRRMRLMGSAVTTPDTIVPPTEAILRDYLLGQEWMRSLGMSQVPEVAYFPDSFGHSPALPSLLRAAGMNAAGITRIDGMWFVGCELDLPRNFPRPGSSASLLLKEEKTLDFLWQDAASREILAHWNAFTYGQGELLAHRGLTRGLDLPLAIPDRSESNVRSKIERYVTQLAPLARTPYLLCPIGFDFSAPLPGLVELLDRYNERTFPSTGTWCLNAGLDDYFALVSFHRSSLPQLTFDPNPTFSGFYSSRPTLKHEYAQLLRTLLDSEKLVVSPEVRSRAPGLWRKANQRLRQAWWLAASADHHDFITGTSPDRVLRKEQLSWIRRAQASADSFFKEVSLLVTPPEIQRHPPKPELLEWSTSGSSIVARNGCFDLVWDSGSSSPLVSLKALSGEPLLANRSGELVLWTDSGGLWRMGHEYRGGKLAVRETSLVEEVQASQEVDGVLLVEARGTLGKSSVLWRWWLAAGLPWLRVAVEAAAPDRQMVTFRFASGESFGVPEELMMDVTGGVVTRPVRKAYDPTFWLAQSWVEMRREGRLSTVLLGSEPFAFSSHAGGQHDVIVARNATAERAYGFLPILAFPAVGHDRAPHRLDLAIGFGSFGARTGVDGGNGRLDSEIPPGDLGDPRYVASSCFAYPPGSVLHPRRVDAVLWPSWIDPARASLNGILCSSWEARLPSGELAPVEIVAAKPAEDGEGIVVRLECLGRFRGPFVLSCPGGRIRGGSLCDAREHVVGELLLREPGVLIEGFDGPLVSVKLVLED